MAPNLTGALTTAVASIAVSTAALAACSTSHAPAPKPHSTPAGDVAGQIAGSPAGVQYGLPAGSGAGSGSAHVVTLKGNGSYIQWTAGSPGSQRTTTGDMYDQYTVPDNPPDYYAVTATDGSCEIDYDGSAVSVNTGAVAACEIDGNGNLIS